MKSLKIFFCIFSIVLYQLLNQRVTAASTNKVTQLTTVCENASELYYGGSRAGVDGSCYPSNLQGPCQPNMILIPAMSNKLVGVCDCDNTNVERALLYHEKTNKCYSIFTQGYCRPSEWLILTKNGEQKCESNKCLSCSKQKSGSEWVPLKNGSCVELGKKTDQCKKSEVIKFFQFKIYPACNYVRKDTINISGIGVPGTQCPVGYSKSPLGHCAIDWDFD